ncbi:hypothetical protein O6H91_Y345000 [Diphasiastrum complanatum]|nr:hypothetical protein O6H91_Y345000 [Diphasiastrum complanatum]
MDVAREQVGDGELAGNLLKQGAEARVYKSSFMGREAVVKERFAKKYRHPSLDSKLTLKRFLGVCTVSSVLHLLHFLNIRQLNSYKIGQ